MRIRIKYLSVILTMILLLSSFSLFSFAKDAFEVTSAKLVGEYDVLIEFSQPIEFNYNGLNHNREDGPYICLVWLNSSNETIYKWNGIIRYADNTHKKLVYTLSQIIDDNTSINTLYEMSTSGNHLAISIEERGDDEGVRNNGYIENITIEGTPDRLPGTTLVGDYDAIVLDIEKDFTISLDPNQYEGIMTAKTHGKVSVKNVYDPKNTETETETIKQTETSVDTNKETKSKTTETEVDQTKPNESPDDGDITLYIAIVSVLLICTIVVLISIKKKGYER